jgi:formylmethanofuran dehydrogenase subunit B
MSSATIINDAICSFCGCLCDDISVEVDGGKVKRVRHACRLGSSKIMGHGRIESPMIRKDGVLVESSFQEAYDRSAQILLQANSPSCTVGHPLHARLPKMVYSWQKRLGR